VGDVVLHDVKLSFTSVDSFKDYPLAAIFDFKDGVPHLVDHVLLKSNNLREPPQTSFVTEYALEMLEGVFLKHPNDNRSADRIRKDPHVFEAFEQTPIEGFSVDEFSANNLQSPFRNRLRVIEVEHVLLWPIQHYFPALLSTAKLQLFINSQNERKLHHQRTFV
jgi:hypothetical protein